MRILIALCTTSAFACLLRIRDVLTPGRPGRVHLVAHPGWAVVAAVAVGLCLIGVVLPLQARTTATTRLVEPRKLYTEEAMQPVERALVAFAYRFAALGDLDSAIEAMQTAANRLVQRRNDNFELWDNLAELYCVAASRERDAKRAAGLRRSGLALIQEFRCAGKFYSRGAEGMPCYGARGMAPNPAFSPLCFQLFCAPGSRDIVPQDRVDDEDTDEAMTKRMQSVRLWHGLSYREDAANLGAIEAACEPRSNKRPPTAVGRQ